MFFFSPRLEDLMRFDLLSCLLPCSVSLCVVPLLECTSSINAEIGGKERNQSYNNTINEHVNLIWQIPYIAHQGIHARPCRISPCQFEEISGCKVQKIPAIK